MKRFNRAALATAMLLLALGATRAPAQSGFTNILRPGVSYPTLAQAHYSFLADQLMRQQWARQSAARAQQAVQGGAPAQAPAPGATAAAAPRAPLSATDLRPAGPRNAAQLLAAGLADPQERAAFLQACREIQATVEATPGFRRHNLAAALTLLIGSSLQVVSGRELDDAATEGLMRTLNDDLVDAGLFRGLTPELRTQLYDRALLVGGLIAGLASHAQDSGNAELLAQARQMAGGALASVGLGALAGAGGRTATVLAAPPAATPPASPLAPTTAAADASNPQRAPLITAQAWYKTAASYSHWGSNPQLSEMGKLFAGQGYARKTWQFGNDGRYRFRLEVWSMTYKPKVLSGLEETGRWRQEGDRISVQPERALVYVEDKDTRRRLSEQPTRSGPTTYVGRMHWLSGMQQWYLVLAPADGQRTEREGEFDQQPGFPNAYFYGPPPKVGG